MIHIKIYRRTAAFLAVITLLAFAHIMPKAAAANFSSTAGQVTAPGALNVRSAASTTGTILKALPAGSTVTLMSRTGNWWYVEYGPSRFGYASADYIKTVPGTYPVTVSSAVAALNVRSGPGTSYSIIGTVLSGQTVLVLSASAGWDRILCNGTLVGYASVTYLKSASSSMAWPVPASHKLNQYFSSTHQGIDVGASVRAVPGDQVVAAADGKVVWSGTLSGYGYVVYIDSIYNGQPIQTRYAHLDSAPLVPAGATVSKGQLLGYMGNTGTSSGVHLHFEVRIRSSAVDCIANADSTPVNPLDYVS